MFSNFSAFHLLSESAKHSFLSRSQTLKNPEIISGFKESQFEFYCTCEVSGYKEAFGIVFYKIIRDGLFNSEAWVFSPDNVPQNVIHCLNKVGANLYSDFVGRLLHNKLNQKDKISLANLEPLLLGKLSTSNTHKSINQ